MAVSFSRRAGLVAAAVRAAPSGFSLADRLRAVPVMMLGVLSGRWSGVSRTRVVLALLAVGYVLSPLDLLPDVLLPFGVLDDAAVAAVAVGFMLNAADRWLARDELVEPLGERGPRALER